MDDTKNGVKLENVKIIKISKKKFIISTVTIAVVLVILVILGGLSSSRMKFGTFGGDAMMVGNTSSNSIAPYFDDRYKVEGQDSSINDTREFLKTNYSGNIKARDVKKTVTDVKNIVKGSDGRIDSFRSSDKNGYITFVVAKSKFDAFRDEIESLTHKKLYTENISSVNLLSQKQEIEQNGSNIQTSLEKLKTQKNKTETEHLQIISTINKDLAKTKSELESVKSQIAKSTDQQLIASLKIQEQALNTTVDNQVRNLKWENSNYESEIKNIDNQINNQNTNLDQNNKQDTKFLDNVETVNGSISVNWVSIWDLAKIYSPISPVIIIIVLIIIIWIILKKKGIIPKVVME